ncbi:MAG: proprotein convertase P-domain-containing protein [Saprospiraceae bacterium]
MKKTNFTHFLFKINKTFLFLGLILSSLTALQAQTPVPGVCRVFRQNYQGPGNRILNNGTALISGTAPLPAGSNGVVEISAGLNTDQPAGPGGAIPPNHTIYKVSVAVSLNHPRMGEVDIMLGYNAPVFTGPNTWAAGAQTTGPQTRWVTLSTDNGGDLSWSLPTFDDDADGGVGTPIDFPTPAVNNNFTVSRDYANATGIQTRIIPEEPLSQLAGMPATGAGGQGGVFFIAVRDDTPAPPGSINATFDGSLGGFTVTLITIPTIEYGGTYPVGQKYTNLTTQSGMTLATTNPNSGIRTSEVFTSGPNPDSIRNNTTLSKGLIATGLTGRTIMDLDVRVALRHTFLGDLAMSLTSPSGTTVTLMNRRGGNIDWGPSLTYLNQPAPAQPATFPVPADQRSPSGHVIFPSIIFSDESDSITVSATSMFGNTIASQAALTNFGLLVNGSAGLEANDNTITDQDYQYSPNYPYATASGTNQRGFFQFTPEEGLGAFRGEDVRGVWTLKITDNNGRDAGVLDRFEIRVGTIPKPCILDVGASGTAGCSPADSVGNVSINVCSNHYPLDGEFIKVDTVFGHNTPPGIGAFLVGTNIQVPLGTTVFTAGSRNTALANNPRVIYNKESFVIDAVGTPLPDPAVVAQQLTIQNVKKLIPFFSPPPIVYPNTLPRHGFRMIPRIPAQQSYCRWPARTPVTAGAPADLDQNPTDSVGLSTGNRPPDAVCKDKITITLDTAANAGIAIVKPFDLEVTGASSDDCTMRGGLQFLTLGSRIGANLATNTTCGTGVYLINFDNANTNPAYTGANTCPVVSPATNDVKIAESLAAISGKTPDNAFLVRITRAVTAPTTGISAIGINDIKATLKWRLPNGTIITRTYANTAAVAAPPTGSVTVPLALSPGNQIISPLATVLDARVETKVTVTTGFVSALGFELGTLVRDSLRFTTMPRTVTCADIGKPTKVMLVVKDRSNNVDSCYVNVMVMDGIAPTITCGTDQSVTLPTVTDCSHNLTLAQVQFLAPQAIDHCLPLTSVESPLQRSNSIAPGIGFMIENTTSAPIIVESLNFPVLAPRDMFIRAYIVPQNLTVAPAQIDQLTFPSSMAYPILSSAVLNNPANWIFWGQNIVPAQTPGTISEIEFRPKNYSNLTLNLGTATGPPYTSPGSFPDIGASLVIPAGARYGVYLAIFGVDANGYPFPAANNTTFGIVHSNVTNGGIVVSAPYPLPSVAAQLPPVIIRGGWNTNTANIGPNEFESPGYPQVANPTVPPSTPAIFEGVVNFPLAHQLLGAPVPIASAGGSVRMFAGKVNYIPAMVPAPTAPTGNNIFVLPSQKASGTIGYFQKTPVFTPGVFSPNTPRAIYIYDGIKQISGIDFQKPYPIGKTVNVFQVTDRAGNTATCSQTVEVKPAPGAVPPVLVCQDLVNLSLDAFCSDTLKASEFLANATNAKCLGAYRIEILSGTNVVGVQTGSYVGTPFRDLIGKTYAYKVIDAANSNNFCWGNVKFEDKFPPKVVCPENITVDDCSADLVTSPTLVYTQTYTNPSNFTSNFAAVGANGISSSAIPVNAPKGAKVISVKVETTVTLTNAVTLSRLFYNLVTPSGGLIQLGSQPGLIDNGFAGIPCGPFANNTIVRYNFNDNGPLAPLVVASGYPCPPPNGTYFPLDAINDNLAGIDAEGDWFIQFQEAATPTNTGQGALLAGANDLKLIITMSVPIESASVQEFCTLNLVPQLAESIKTNTCTQDTSIVKVIKRTYSAKDAAGNLGSCSHTVSFKRAKFRDQVYPSDIVLDCTYNNLKSNPSDQDAINKAIDAGAQIASTYRGPWFDAAGNPHPNVVGRPRPFTCTSYSVGYTDMRIDNICGTGNGSFAVRRTWKVYDACTNKAVEYQQYISVQDIVSPSITPTQDQTISPPVGQCIATLTIPAPEVTDNCNDASELNIVYELYSNSNLTIPAGSQSPVAANKFDNIAPSPVNSINGTITEDWYYVKYTVTDKCGNTATATSRIKVTDRIAPIAVCAPLVKVSLTHDGTAYMTAQEFDRGSYDNCGNISKYQVWRLDDGDCVAEDLNKNGFLNDEIDLDNDGFGDYPEFDYYKHPQDKVKFCCSDIGDTVMVIYRVWDNSPILGRNQFRPTDPNYDYGVGNRGNVNICMASVIVEDKLPPVVVTQDTTVICGNVVLGKAWLDAHTPQPQIPTTGFGEYNKFTYFSENQQYDIKDGVTSIKFPVTGLNSIRNLDLNVKLNFFHNNIGNLFAELVSPAGTKVSLFRQPKTRIGKVPYLSTGADVNNPFNLTFDDEPSLTPADYVQFTGFDDLGVSGTDVKANDVSTLNRKFNTIDQLAKIEKEKLDGIWTLNIGKISPYLGGEGAVLERGVSLELQGYPQTGNVFSSKEEGRIYSSPDSLTTFVVIPVTGIDTIQDLNVAVKLHHTNIGNLSATLTSPEGTTVELFVQPTSQNGPPYSSPLINGVPSTNIFRLSFNDEPSVNPNFLPQFSSIPGVGDTITPATLGTVNGTYLGLGQFSAFDGQSASGNWLLTITRLDPTLPDSGAVIAGGAQLQIASNRTGYNTSYLFDNCSDYTLSCKDSIGINNCGVGYIKRAWTLSDAGGRTATDNQYYNSTGRSHYTVVFPRDTVLTCLTGSTDTAYTGRPRVTYVAGCPVVAVGHTDDIINAVTNACYRIKRTWKIANLCQSGMMKGIQNSATPDNALMASTTPNGIYVNNTDGGTIAGVDTDGYVEYVQFISVNDKVPPVITNAPTSIRLDAAAKECKVSITLPRLTVTDVCSDKIDTSWTISNKTTLAIVKSGNSLPYTHTFLSSDFGTTFTVTYKMTDRCGNYSYHYIDVTPRDIIKPTPVCYQGLSADLLPTTGNVMLMAPQFDAGSYDGNNCTATANLKVRIERGTPGFSTFSLNADNQVILPTAAADMVIIDCKGIVPIRLWVTDAAGNSDYCDTYVQVQNNMGATAADCPAVNANGNRVLVTLTTLKSQLVKNADVSIELGSGIVAAKPFGNDYAADIPAGQGSLKVSAEKNDNPLNGVSTFDLVMMTKHILSLQPITSPYLKIAADINNNGTVSTSDVVELRKMILAIQTGFKNNKSWRFFTSDMKEKPEFDNPLKAQVVNFTGIKIGDINLSANSASPKTTGTLQFDVNEKVFVAGEEVKATFNAADIANMEGYQFTLGYDKDVLELSNIEGNPENFGMVENGSLTTSWNGNAQNTDNLFTLVFKAKKAGNLSEMLNINSKFTNAEAYSKSGDYNNVTLKFNGARDRFALYQNQPNPFMGRTIVGFNLPKAEHAKMTIFDIAGRVIKTVEGDFSKGYNEVAIDEILGSGVLNYKLETATETATKSMIILE